MFNRKISKMPTEFKRKLYKRGSSFETTIPMPLLFALDKSKKHNIFFSYDPETNKWYIKFEEISKQSFESLSDKSDKIKKGVESKI